MNTDTGEVRRMLDKVEMELLANEVEIDPANLSRPARRQLEQTGRTRVFKNSKCPCGSGKRFKNCHRTGP
jgi:uncharacterized protein YecA (UPF0149 family)